MTGQWVNTEIRREISVRDNSIIDCKTVINVERTGDAAPPYVLSLPDASHVGYLRISSGGRDLEFGSDISVLSKNERTDVSTYELKAEVVGTSIEVRTFQGDMLNPYPTHAMELESQQVMLIASLVVPSMYSTESQTTTVVVPEIAGDLIAVGPSSHAKPLSSKKVDIGPFSKADSDEFVREKLRVHFGFDKPLPVLSSVVKMIEISQLGQVIAVHEEMELWNRGASLKGEFSRSPHTHLKYSGPTSPFQLGHTLQVVDAIVPVTAFDIHYRDVIGNVSSSTARRESDLTRIGLSPRFPLIGGWKTEFSFMYNVPFAPSNVVQRNEETGEYLLSFPIGHSLANVFAEQVIVGLILPAGVMIEDVKISIPGRHVEILSRDKTFGWLDTPLMGSESGRTMITIAVGPFVAGEKNTVKSSLLVTYVLPSWALAKAPGLMSVYILALFLMIIFSRRMAMQITNPKEAGEEEAKNADHDLCEFIDDELTNLWALTGELLDAVVVHKEKKEKLNEFKQEFNSRYSEIISKVDSLTPQFIAENNRVNRTIRLMLLLKNVKDIALSVLDSAIAGKDYTSAAGRLVDAEEDAKVILDRVESGCPPTAPSSPAGTPPLGKSASSGITVLKKRK